MTLRQLALILLPTAFLVPACGGDDGPEPTGGGQTSVDSESGTADSSGTADGPTTTGPGESTGGGELACGDALVCDTGEVCIEDVIAPACTNLDDPEAMCPPGQDLTYCGGAGIPCCCEPPPRSEFRCITPSGCGDVVDCTCLGEICTEGRECAALGVDPTRAFACEELPTP